jgi:xylulokinase
VAVLGVPVEVPAPSEDVADGAARQAAWVLSGADHPPAWQGRERITFTATPTPHVIAAYRVAAARVAEEFRSPGGPRAPVTKCPRWFPNVAG